MKPRDTALIDTIFIHHFNINWGTMADAEEWQKEKGFDMVGYNRVIRNQFPTFKSWKDNTPDMATDGMVEIGRPDNVVPAGVRGHNTTSVHLAMVGDGVFTGLQLKSLITEIREYIKKYPKIKRLLRHSDRDPKKPHCPGLSDDYMETLRDLTLNFIGPI